MSECHNQAAIGLKCPEPTRCTWRIQIASALLLALTIGCDLGSGGKRPIKPVTVTVTYKGAPVADANVTFISDDAEPIAAFGKTDAQGVAKPKTPELGDGVAIGKHKITINKEQILNNVKVADQDSPDYAPLPPGGAPVPVVKHLVPQKYSAPGTTTLTAEVTSSGPNELKLELTD